MTINIQFIDLYLLDQYNINQKGLVEVVTGLGWRYLGQITCLILLESIIVKWTQILFREQINSILIKVSFLLQKKGKRVLKGSLMIIAIANIRWRSRAMLFLSFLRETENSSGENNSQVDYFPFAVLVLTWKVKTSSSSRLAITSVV